MEPQDDSVSFQGFSQRTPLLNPSTPVPTLRHRPSVMPEEIQAKRGSSRLRKILKWRRYLILFATPIILAPLPLAIPGKESRCAYCILVMAVFWITEMVPLAVTALLPLVLFPLFGVLGSKQVSTPYFKDTNVLFVGGLIVAVAVEHWNLHKRIALRILLLIGSQPRRLMLGFMLTTAFLSMWISNTATTAMMVPIAEAVLMQMKEEKEKEKEKERRGAEEERDDEKGAGDRGSVHIEMEQVNEPTIALDKSLDEGLLDVSEADGHQIDDENDAFSTRMNKGLLLCVAYAANCGGTATLTGTGPNLVFSGQAQSLFPKGPGVGFAQWFGFAFPEMLVLLFIAWLWLQFLFLGCNLKCFSRHTSPEEKRRNDAVKRVLHQHYDRLGPMSFAETAVLCHFVLLALLWLFRDPKFMPGWAAAFEKGYVRDATAAMIIAFSLFVFPSERPKVFCWNPDGKVTKPPPALLTWKTVSQKLSWGIVILLGSGFAMAEACKESGLSDWLGQQLSGLQSIPSYGIVIIVCIMITTFTEVTSNVATATIFLPILATLGESIGVHPYYLMIPATVSCSFAFMLPVATPPNAIVFAGGQLKVKDMAKAGFGMNIFCVVILIICINTYGVAMFDLNTFPEWAMGQAGAKNVTLVCRNETVP